MVRRKAVPRKRTTGFTIITAPQICLPGTLSCSQFNHSTLRSRTITRIPTESQFRCLKNLRIIHDHFQRLKRERITKKMGRPNKLGQKRTIPHREHYRSQMESNRSTRIGDFQNNNDRKGTIFGLYICIIYLVYVNKD